MRVWIDLFENVSRPNRVFHVSPSENEASIRQYGIALNSISAWDGSHYDSRRLYVVSSVKAAQALVDDMFSRSLDLQSLTVFMIDSALIEGPLRLDPDWDWNDEPAYYCEVAIPPEAIIGNTLVFDRSEWSHWLDGNSNENW